MTILSEDGVPTPVVHTRLRAPLASMKPAGDVAGTAKAPPLYTKYGTPVDRESARELLAARMVEPDEKRSRYLLPKRSESKKEPRGDPVTDFLGSRQGKTLQREVVRGVIRAAQEAFLAGGIDGRRRIRASWPTCRSS